MLDSSSGWQHKTGSRRVGDSSSRGWGWPSAPATSGGFPRVAAENGGAAFLIPWLLFLFLWSLPLLIAEFGFGRGSRRGVIGSFADLVGRRYAWMGGFVAVTSVMILFYYSVVTGWTLKYFTVTLLGSLPGSAAEEYWTSFSASVWQPLAFQIVAVLIARRDHQPRGSWPASNGPTGCSSRRCSPCLWWRWCAR